MKKSSKFNLGGCLAVLLFTITVEAEQFVTVQPIQVCDDLGANCATADLFADEANKIWGQAGISVHFLPTKQLNKSEFLHVDASFPGPEEDLVVFGNAPHHGQHEDPRVINMWFVDTLLSAGDVRRNGVACGPLFPGVCGDLSGAIISGDIYTYNDGGGRIDTISHEIGHILGLGHQSLGAGGRENLMSAREDRQAPESILSVHPEGDGLSQLNAEQIAVAISSNFVTSAPVPEPTSQLLWMQGWLAYCFLRRRQNVR